MNHYLSIDFESWAYPDLPEFIHLTSQKRKKLDAGYVRESAETIIKILKKYQTKLTFFVLAQLYDWYPDAIEKISQAGHEIAFHTYTHKILKTKKDLLDSLNASEKFIKKFRPIGFRSPQILIKKNFYRILKNYGFNYSSSTYGSFGKTKLVDGVVEIPVTSYCRLPIGSGYLIALLGKQVENFYRLQEKRGEPMVSFIHNWQIIKPKKATFPNYKYLLKKPYYFPYTLEIRENFESLLRKFSFEPMVNLITKGRK